MLRPGSAIKRKTKQVTVTQQQAKVNIQIYSRTNHLTHLLYRTK